MRKPAIYWRENDAVEGGMLAVEEVSPQFEESMHRLILLVSAGVKPADIPIIGPLNARSSLNISTLGLLGVELPNSSLERFSAFYK